MTLSRFMTADYRHAILQVSSVRPRSGAASGGYMVIDSINETPSDNSVERATSNLAVQCHPQMSLAARLARPIARVFKKNDASAEIG